MNLTFRAKLLASHLLLVVAVVLAVLLVLNLSLGADLRADLDARLEEQAKGAAHWVGEGGEHHAERMARLATRLREVVHAKEVTIFSLDGVPLSGPLDEREPLPEVAVAQSGGIGRATRVVGDEEVHYVAAPSRGGVIVRLAVPLSNIHDTLASMRSRLLFAAGLAVVLALLLGFLASRIASNPLRAMTAAATRITRGDYDVDVATASPDEFGILSRSLGALARELKAKIGDLVRERDRLSAIFAGMAEGVLVLDPGGVITAANPAAAEILSFHGTLFGKRLAELAIDAEVRAFIEKTLGAGELHEAEMHANGGGRVLEVYARPLPSGSVVVLRDMTRVNRLLTMRRDFVANVSHELRTPVTAIQGYAETLLRSSADPETMRQFLEILDRQARRLGTLIEGLLRLSELEAKAPAAAEREPFDAGAIAELVKGTMRERAKAAGMEVALDFEGAVVALGDAGGLEQVLDNLVDNALKYGKGKAVRIRGRALGEKVVVTVADDGPGIEPRHLPHLFERFYRVDAGRSRDKGGSGLGLAIVKHLLEAMGGSVRVESAVGKGTTFTIELNAGPAAPPPS
jgi:two-component system phosphate regulon sensor histidine kinase PhoR